MRSLVTVVSVVQLVAAAVDVHSVLHKTTARYVPGSYLVGTNGNTHLARGFASPHAELEHDLRKRGVAYTITRVFSDSEIWNGATVRVDDPSDLVEVAQAAGSIHRNYIRELPATPASDGGTSNPVVSDTFSTHQMTGVDKMHAKGIFGNGITIGIIDTGIDYTHPLLGGKFGAGNKVIGGYDFVGDAFNGTNTPHPDDDPLGQCAGHGTHVAGIIGANPNNPFNISGVAYQSSLNAYRIFGCTGGTTDDLIVAAMNRAYKDGNDIITMSLGGASGWTEGVTSVVASKIASMGRVITISAGNDGQYGAWYTSGPATGINAISVGSVDNNVYPFQTVIDSTGRSIPYNAALPIANGTFRVYALSTNTSITDDGCHPLPSSTPDLSAFLVLIRRGGCDFTNKLANAAAKGAKLFFIYDNIDEPPISIDVGDYNAVPISKEDGEYLVNNTLKKNGTVTFVNRITNIPSSTGGLMSSFSTYGPTFDMYLQPSLSAPGGNIFSTWPVSMGSYRVESGTSMSAPFIAGAAALVLQVKGKTPDNARSVRTILQNTASYIPNSKDSNALLESAAHAGAGLVQVYDACYSTSMMSPAELLLNDTTNFAGSHSVTITNNGTKAVAYTITHLAAGTMPTINGTDYIAGSRHTVDQIPHISAPASVTISPSTVTVQPGQSATVSLTFKAPTGLDPKTLPVYSGFIQAKGDDGSTLHSIYLGAAAALKDQKIIDRTDEWLGFQVPFIANISDNPAPGPTTFSMKGNDTATMVFRLAFGSPEVLVHLVNSETNVTSTQRRSFETKLRARSPVGRNLKDALAGPLAPRHGLLDIFSPDTIKLKLNANVTTSPTLGVVFAQDYFPRSSSDPQNQDQSLYFQIPVDTFANGTTVPDGSYKLWLQAWRVDSAQVESWLSPKFTIKRD
ncbi:pyrolysin [Ceratobasidium sp. AG-Ba]|nr:pyrolysin [Ceratobasidium sp. AG-Ba]